MKILLIEDQDYLRISVKRALSPYASVVTASSYQEFKEHIVQSADHFDLYIIDLDLEEDLLGLKILKDLTGTQGYKLILTGRDDQTVIAKAYQLAADDYLVKPFSLDDLKEVMAAVKKTQTDLGFLDDFDLNDIERRALVNTLNGSLPIYLCGETGTGKTTLAKKIHEAGERKEKPFIAFNCSEFSESLMESELFGHVKGAFTGAVRDKKGRIELANGGTLFLDEVATMPISLQAKLLKVIEEREFYCVGGEVKISSDFKLVSASCEDLELMVEKGLFREDLYFRLKGINLRLKPLRESKLKLEKMIQMSLSDSKRRKVIEPAALEAILAYTWPGNLREFAKEMEVLNSQNINSIKLSDLGFMRKRSVKGPGFDMEKAKNLGLKKYIAEIEKEVLEVVLKENKGKIRQTIADLKISSQGFYRIQRCQSLE